jgi:hypothetical protein
MKPEAVALEIASLTASTVKAVWVKIAGVKRAAVSIALRENRRRRTERQHDRDNNANFGAHCPSPLNLALTPRRLTAVAAYSSTLELITHF